MTTDCRVSTCFRTAFALALAREISSSCLALTTSFKASTNWSNIRSWTPIWLARSCSFIDPRFRQTPHGVVKSLQTARRSTLSAFWGRENVLREGHYSRKSRFWQPAIYLHSRGENQRLLNISNQELTIQINRRTVAIQSPISEGETSFASHFGQDSLNSRTRLSHSLQIMAIVSTFRLGALNLVNLSNGELEVTFLQYETETHPQHRRQAVSLLRESAACNPI